MHEVTRIRIRRNGWEFELRTSMPWERVIERCQKDFSELKDIGGPRLPDES